LGFLSVSAQKHSRQAFFGKSGRKVVESPKTLD
jgi:hypothetical protein